MSSNPQRNLPEIPTAFSSLDGLGTPVAFFRASRRARTIPLVCAVICVLAAAVILAYGIAATGTAYSHYGWAAVQALGMRPLLIFWIFIAAGLISGIIAISNWRRGVAVYEGGLAFRELSPTQTWKWEELAALYVAVTRETGLFSRTRHKYTVENQNGTKGSFDDRLEGVVTLGAMLGRQIVERLYPRMAGSFNQGERVPFGALSIDQQGIRIKEQALPWAEVDHISLQRGNLKAQPRTGEVVGVPAAGIPNLDVLLLLLDHVTEIRLEE